MSLSLGRVMDTFSLLKCLCGVTKTLEQSKCSLGETLLLSEEAHLAVVVVAFLFSTQPEGVRTRMGPTAVSGGSFKVLNCPPAPRTLFISLN